MRDPTVIPRSSRSSPTAATVWASGTLSVVTLSTVTGDTTSWVSARVAVGDVIGTPLLSAMRVEGEGACNIFHKV